MTSLGPDGRPGGSPRAPHAAAQRSRRRLTAALLELMHERSFATITITEIAERADLSRRTFYRNFDSKEAILDAHCLTLVDEYIARLRRIEDAQTYDVALTYFEFWTDHLDFLTLLARSGLSSAILRTQNERIGEVFARSGSTRYAAAGDGADGSAAALGYALAYNSGGYSNVLFEWVRGGCRQSPRQMARAMAAMESR